MMMQKLARLPHQIAYLQFNLFDSHDIHRLHNNPDVSWEGYRGAVIMLFTFPGTPNIYYGDEVGLDGHIETMEGCRYPMVWDEKDQDQRYYELYQRLAQLKLKDEVLQRGGFKILYAEGDVLSYARFTDERAYISITSQEDKRCTVRIPVGVLGVDKDSKIKEEFSYSSDYTYEDGYLNVTLQKEEALLFNIKI